MTLRRVTVREFRASFHKLTEPVLIGDGIYFPSNTPGLEAYASGDALWPSGEGSPKGPPSGESPHKAPSPAEAPRSSRHPQRRDADPSVDDPAVERGAPARSQPYALTTDAARDIIRRQQEARDAILRKLATPRRDK